MYRVTFVDADGQARELTANEGQSVMSVAVANGIDQILAECGGSCACGTCHCYVDETWTERLPAPDDSEQGMIECLMSPTERSRLSCQLKMTAALDGLVVHLPREQY
ncbi:2Fe-2S iron-sulfur cluster-binding protein [Aminobacter carboxidus]|uniref:2Fe-2S iron-sulfur cluster binding domain-containing protein n=1 Tax=Aminobacter carboxidus TaxID=376165 RepID=A0ABR9GKM5_9HYPH|nr:2Fe-2S iron-sulfur cluster-binding protein [Aminobacter carboxidus]MBE1204169.1 2Fe-2S iron-sulfur cluster binding domain-containing protein [Aminobacter carboxidus]